MLEKTFDRLSNDNEVISIDRLEIDIGELNINQLTEHLSKRVEEIASNVLHDKIIALKRNKDLKNEGIVKGTFQDSGVSISTHSESKSRIIATYLQTGQIPWNAGVSKERRRFSQLLEELIAEDRREAVRVLRSELKHSLQKRRFIYQSSDKLISTSLLECADPENTGSAIRRVFEPLTGFARGMVAAGKRRKLFTVSDQTELRYRIWVKVIDVALSGPDRILATERWLDEKIHDILQGLLAGRPGSDLPLMQDFKDLKKLADDSSVGRSTRKTELAGVKMWTESVKRFIRKHQKKSGHGADSEETGSEISRSGAGAKAGKSPSIKTRTNAPDGEISKNKAKEQRSRKFKKTDARNRGKSVQVSDKSESDKDNGRTVTDADTGKPITDKSKSSKEKPSLTKVNRQEELHRSYRIDKKTEEAWVYNAGLVLLHPFLVSFLERTGLVVNKKFVSLEAQQRAVHLLQYLVNDGQQETGQETQQETGQGSGQEIRQETLLESPEEELFLNKLLCGLEPEFPIIPEIAITPEEEKECENLLQNVVQKWKALKNSSPEAVRSTFLRREGLITSEGLSGGWKVIVERNTFDVLLDRLPWGISIFKMPWNSFLIHVEW